MRNKVKSLFVVFSVAVLFSSLTPACGASGQQDVTSHDDAAFDKLFNEEAHILLPNAGGNPAGGGSPWLLATKKDDNDKNGAGQSGDAQENEEEEDDEDGDTGFDRLWDVTCCG